VSSSAWNPKKRENPVTGIEVENNLYLLKEAYPRDKKMIFHDIPLNKVI
jgi:hypothetical protein